jgi:hypothetical protein
MNYAPLYLQHHRTEPAAKLKITCPCCSETLEIEFPQDLHVEVVREEIARPKVTERERGGQAPMTVASSNLDEESLRTAMAQGWKLPEKGVPVWLNKVVPSESSRKRSRIMYSILATLSALLIILGTYTVAQNAAHRPVAEVSEETPAMTLKRTGGLLAEEARGTMRRFLSATSWEEKLAFVVNPGQVASKMKEYYKANGLEQGVHAEDFENCLDLMSEIDVRRGVACLARPQKSEFSFSANPVAKLDPRQTISGSAGLYFFRHGKLDWETYIQQEQGSLRNFLKEPRSGTGVFRVVLNRVDSASGSGGAVVLSDPSIVPQALEQIDLAQLPSAISHVMMGLTPGKFRLATVELTWSNQAIPTLNFSGLVCWESRGVGESDLKP